MRDYEKKEKTEEKKKQSFRKFDVKKNKIRWRLEEIAREKERREMRV